MFVLVRANGDVTPLPGVERMGHEDGKLLCFDHGGAFVESYEAADYMIYGEDSRILPLIAELQRGPTTVNKVLPQSHPERCCAVRCRADAVVVFAFDGPHGAMRLGLCRAHRCLVDEQARNVALSRLDLRRLAVSM